MTATDWRFSLIFAQGQPLQNAVKLWKACEDAGLFMVGVADSPNLLRELYVSTTLCALGTSRAKIITYVTNPVTRHPSVAAAAFMSLNEIAPGRIAMGVGSGDSALWSIGKKGARVQQMRDYITAVKALLRGETANWDGYSFKAEWSAYEPFDLPVYVACSGPKILRMAAEVADGAIVTMGFAPEDVAYVRGIVAEGRRTAGRSDRDFALWWNAHVVFDESYEKAAERSLGWSPYWLTMGSMEGKGIPDELKEKFKQLNSDAHDLNAVYHAKDRNKVVLERAKALGVYDWMMRHSPRLFGTPRDVATRLNEFGARDMKQWIFFATSRGAWAGSPEEERLDLINKIGREVTPLLS
ncbi:MAG: LLM class flavin-dependent oxidoreductase [Alphaproteobacteria bacterium]|nr:LLM class flavin-dependent oxidoreductase [Alphaproteobacteria bacterium]